MSIFKPLVFDELSAAVNIRGSLAAAPLAEGHLNR
jgi:hypothetical protein